MKPRAISTPKKRERLKCAHIHTDATTKKSKKRSTLDKSNTAQSHSRLEHEGTASEDGNTSGGHGEHAVELNGLEATVGVESLLTASDSVNGGRDGSLVLLPDVREWDSQGWIEVDDRLGEVSSDRLDVLSLLLAGVATDEV